MAKCKLSHSQALWMLDNDCANARDLARYKVSRKRIKAHTLLFTAA